LFSTCIEVETCLRGARTRDLGRSLDVDELEYFVGDRVHSGKLHSVCIVEVVVARASHCFLPSLSPPLRELQISSAPSDHKSYLMLFSPGVGEGLVDRCNPRDRYQKKRFPFGSQLTQIGSWVGGRHLHSKARRESHIGISGRSENTHNLQHDSQLVARKQQKTPRYHGSH
jgi:hypothetical protein